MTEKKVVAEWKNHINPALISKVNEFKLLGYYDVTTADIWHCLEKYVWDDGKKIRLYVIVQDILGLRPSTYMNYSQLEVLQDKDDDIMSSIRALLHER